jgi:hypothetical protein
MADAPAAQDAVFSRLAARCVFVDLKVDSATGE